MTFRKLIETMDSSYEILRKTSFENVYFYYFDIKDQNYRIFIEKVNRDLHIGFEWFDGELWDINTSRNELSSKEIFGIFGTIKKILKQDFKDLESIYVFSSNVKKSQVYYTAIRKLAPEFNLKDINRSDDFVLAKKSNVKINKWFKYKK